MKTSNWYKAFGSPCDNRSITNHGTCYWWQLPQAAKRTWMQSWSAVVKVTCDQASFFLAAGKNTKKKGTPDRRLLSRWWHFCRLSTNANFLFLEKRAIHFFQRCLQPFYFSRSPPSTQLNLPFCASVQFFRNYIRAFSDRIKIEKLEGSEQSRRDRSDVQDLLPGSFIRSTADLIAHV